MGKKLGQNRHQGSWALLGGREDENTLLSNHCSKEKNNFEGEFKLYYLKPILLHCRVFGKSKLLTNDWHECSL